MFFFWWLIFCFKIVQNPNDSFVVTTLRMCQVTLPCVCVFVDHSNETVFGAFAAKCCPFRSDWFRMTKNIWLNEQYVLVVGKHEENKLVNLINSNIFQYTVPCLIYSLAKIRTPFSVFVCIYLYECKNHTTDDYCFLDKLVLNKYSDVKTSDWNKSWAFIFSRHFH